MRIYENSPKAIGFDGGKQAEESWIRFDKEGRNIYVDSCNADGEPYLNPTNLKLLITRLLLWLKEIER